MHPGLADRTLPHPDRCGPRMRKHPHAPLAQRYTLSSRTTFTPSARRRRSSRVNLRPALQVPGRLHLKLDPLRREHVEITSAIVVRPRIIYSLSHKELREYAASGVQAEVSQRQKSSTRTPGRNISLPVIVRSFMRWLRPSRFQRRGDRRLNRSPICAELPASRIWVVGGNVP